MTCPEPLRKLEGAAITASSEQVSGCAAAAQHVPSPVVHDNRRKRGVHAEPSSHLLYDCLLPC